MKKKVLGVAAGLCLLVLVACTPKFPVGGTLTATDSDPYVVLEWPAASPYVNPVASYGVEVNGVEVSRVDAWATSCVLKGLHPSTTYQLSVTAYDTGGTWSGNAANNGRLTVAHTTPATGDTGPTVYCDTAPPEM
jgi:hypothetical protein